MKIYVMSRFEILKYLEKNPNFADGKWVISIFDKGSFSPFPDRFNVLKLEFDDVTERDTEDGLLHFNVELAKKIHEFIKNIPADDKKEFIVHCAAGVSRSGAVGYMMNEWFNKFLKMNRIDNEAFTMNNPHIMPNPEVVRILKNELFGTDYRGVFVNDYTYDMYGDRHDNFKEV